MQRKNGYTRNGYIEYYIWGLFLLFLFFLAYKFPVVGDDWYALRVHITSFQELIENGVRHWNNVNGRWLGHMAVILSMSSKILCAAARSIIIWLIMILGYKNSGFKCKEGCLIVFLYILAVPKEIFSETYSWAAGFFNYVPPVLLIFLYLYLIRNEFSQKSRRYSAFKIIAAFAIGICSQLFIENVTIYVVILAVVINGFYIKRFKKISLITLAHLIGSFIDTFLMFLSPVYQTVAEGTDTYRTTPQGLSGLLETVKGNWAEISRYTVRGNTLLIFTVAVVCAYLLYRTKIHDRKIQLMKTVNSCVITGATAYFFISIFLEWDEKIGQYNFFFALDIFMTLLYIAGVLSTIAFYVKDKGKRERALFYLVSAVVLVGPLTVVTPIGPRCFYSSYIFTIIAFLNLIVYIINQEGWKLEEVFVPLCGLTFCVSLFYIYIFSNISDVEQERNSYIIEQMKNGETTVIIPEFPYSDYLHEPHGTKIGLEYYYKEAGDIQFEYMPYDEWNEFVS